MLEMVAEHMEAAFGCQDSCSSEDWKQGHDIKTSQLARLTAEPNGVLCGNTMQRGED